MGRWWLVVGLVGVACGSSGGGRVARSDAGATPAGSDAGTSGEDGGATLDGGAGQDAGVPGTDAGFDAGTPRATDGGAPDGGAIACTDGPDALDAGPDTPACAALFPHLGPPVEHRYSEHTDDFPIVLCNEGGGPSDGNGVVLHPARAESFFGYTADRTGKTLGTYGSPQADRYYVHPLRSSFAGEASYTGALGSFPLEFWGEDGAYLDPGTTVNGSRPWNDTGVLGLLSSYIPPDQRPPGCGDDLNVASTFQLIHYDDRGNVLGKSSTFGCFTAEIARGEFLTNRAGLTIVLTQGESGGDPKQWTLYWLAPDLSVRAKWHPAESLGRVEMGLLADDSIALKVDDRWTYRVRSGATKFDAAPCWMQERKNTQVTMIHSRGGYAVRWADRSLDQGVEIVRLDGKSCGFLDLGEPRGGCTSAQCVAIGLDGTITQSAYAADAGAGMPQTCVLPFWPGVLGPSVR